MTTDGIEGKGIEGIDAITYCTDGSAKNWDEAKRFFADWGLQSVGPKSPDQSTEVQVWETLNGAQVIVHLPDDPRLPPAIEPGPTLREVVWGVRGQEALNSLAEKATRSHETCVISYVNGSKKTVAQVTLTDPHGLQIRFRPSAKRALDVQGAATNPWGNTQRVDQASPVYERATPVEIGHVVLFSDCLIEAEAFYQSLGFVTSDSYPGRGIFMRCSVEGGHHDLFLLQVPNKAKGLNHIAFSVRDIHEVFGGGLHMSRCGWKTQLGPGRHPISSAYFWYFENPCGGLIEYNADEDKLTGNWQPREFTPGPTVFAEWAIDGGLDGHTRRQPQVAASGAFLSEKRP